MCTITLFFFVQILFISKIEGQSCQLDTAQALNINPANTPNVMMYPVLWSAGIPPPTTTFIVLGQPSPCYLQWTLNFDNETNYYTISSQPDNQYLLCADSSIWYAPVSGCLANSPIVVGYSALWTVESADDQCSEYYIRNVPSGKYLQVGLGSAATSSVYIGDKDNSTPNQYWTFAEACTE